VVVYRVDPDTRIATDADVSNGDGILLQGRTDTLTDPDFAVPATVAALGSSLYAVNARFGAPDPGQVPYQIVRVDGS